LADYAYHADETHGYICRIALVSVGSTNFDMRSFELNDEASLNIYDNAFAAQMTLTYEQDPKAAKRYSLDQWQHRSRAQKLTALVLLPIRSQL
jgi:cardiolipin synthase